MRTLLLLPVLVSTLAGAARAEDVDAAIVFAVDDSASIDQMTAKLQREGHAAALCDPSVTAAISSGAKGCIAIAYLEWSSAGKARSVLPWTTLCSRADALKAAQAIRQDGTDGSDCEGYCATSVSYAIDVSTALLDSYKGNARSKIIDISASGTNNDGPKVGPSRQSALRRGYVINAIVVPQMRYGIAHHYLSYFVDEVIGGVGSFALEPSTVQDYGRALSRKFAKEISAADRPVARGENVMPE